MNKSELISAVANKTGLQVKQAELAFNGIIEEITNVMAKKDKLTVVGFGTFGTSDRAEREGRNPSTGEKMKIEARTVPTFKAGKNLKEKVK